MAELVWREGVLIKEFPPEAYIIKNLDDALAFLKTEDGQKRSLPVQALYGTCAAPL